MPGQHSNDPGVPVMRVSRYESGMWPATDRIMVAEWSMRSVYDANADEEGGEVVLGLGGGCMR